MLANRLNSEASIRIGNDDLLLVFDHAAQAKLQTLFGLEAWELAFAKAMDRWEMPTVDHIIAIGLEARQPGQWTAAKLALVTPVIPRIPATRAVQAALELSVWGPQGPPREPPKRPTSGPKRTFSWWPSAKRSDTALH